MNDYEMLQYWIGDTAEDPDTRNQLLDALDAIAKPSFEIEEEDLHPVDQPPWVGGRKVTVKLKLGFRIYETSVQINAFQNERMKHDDGYEKWLRDDLKKRCVHNLIEDLSA